jgi:hypothetical protein
LLSDAGMRGLEAFVGKMISGWRPTTLFAVAKVYPKDHDPYTP